MQSIPYLNQPLIRFYFSRLRRQLCIQSRRLGSTLDLATKLLCVHSYTHTQSFCSADFSLFAAETADKSPEGEPHSPAAHNYVKGEGEREICQALVVGSGRAESHQGLRGCCRGRRADCVCMCVCIVWLKDK